LVGASFSGFNVRVFAGKYPSEVAGAVLVDSAYQDQGRYEPRTTLVPVNRLPPAIRTVLCTVVPVAAQVGALRFLLHRSDPRRDALPGFRAELQTKSFVAAAGCDAWAKSAAGAHAAGNFGNGPLIVLTAGQAFAEGDPQADEELKAFHEIRTHQLQVQLTQLSS
jgi:pimeloyl-ACP methyl ester carboxylesterase